MSNRVGAVDEDGRRVVLIGVDQITGAEKYTMADTPRTVPDELVAHRVARRQCRLFTGGGRVLRLAGLELEVSLHLGSERHERTAERRRYLNGYHERDWDTLVGMVELQVPRVRDGGFAQAML